MPSGFEKEAKTHGVTVTAIGEVVTERRGRRFVDKEGGRSSSTAPVSPISRPTRPNRSAAKDLGIRLRRRLNFGIFRPEFTPWAS